MKKELVIKIDKEDIENKILELKDEWEETHYVHYGESEIFGDPYITKEEYDENIDQFLAEFRKAISDPDILIKDFPKKKNGTFNRRNMKVLSRCRNCVAIHEWHNTWIYKTIKLKAWDDTTLVVSFVEEVDTPA